MNLSLILTPPLPTPLLLLLLVERDKLLVTITRTSPSRFLLLLLLLLLQQLHLLYFLHATISCQQQYQPLHHPPGLLLVHRLLLRMILIGSVSMTVMKTSFLGLFHPRTRSIMQFLLSRSKFLEFHFFFFFFFI